MRGEGRVSICRLIYELLITVGVKMRLVSKLPLTHWSRLTKQHQRLYVHPFSVCTNKFSSWIYTVLCIWPLMLDFCSLWKDPLKLTISVQKLTWRCCTSWFSALLLWVRVTLIFILLEVSIFMKISNSVCGHHLWFFLNICTFLFLRKQEKLTWICRNNLIWVENNTSIMWLMKKSFLHEIQCKSFHFC